MTNVFKIKHNKETHVYRTDSPADKKGLLAQFRQVAEELSQKKRKEREGEHERRKSMWQGAGGVNAGIGGVSFSSSTVSPYLGSMPVLAELSCTSRTRLDERVSEKGR